MRFLWIKKDTRFRSVYILYCMCVCVWVCVSLYMYMSLYANVCPCLLFKLMLSFQKFLLKHIQKDAHTHLYILYTLELFAWNEIITFNCNCNCNCSWAIGTFWDRFRERKGERERETHAASQVLSARSNDVFTGCKLFGLVSRASNFDNTAQRSQLF